MPLTQGAKVFLGAGAAAGAVYLWRSRRAARAEAAYAEGANYAPPRGDRTGTAPLTRSPAGYRIGSGEAVLLPPAAAHRAPGVAERVGDAGAVVGAHAKAAVKVRWCDVAAAPATRGPRGEPLPPARSLSGRADVATAARSTRAGRRARGGRGGRRRRQPHQGEGGEWRQCAGDRQWERARALRLDLTLPRPTRHHTAAHLQEAARDVATAGREVASTAAGRPPAVVHVRETPSVTQVPVGDRVVERPVARQAELPPITADVFAAQQAAEAEAQWRRQQQQQQQQVQSAATTAAQQHYLPPPAVHAAPRQEAHPHAEVPPSQLSPQYPASPVPPLPQEPRGPQLQLQFRPPPSQQQPPLYGEPPQQPQYAPPQPMPPPQQPLAPGESSYLTQSQARTSSGGTGEAPAGRARAAGAVVSEHAKAAAGDVRRAGSEAGALLSTHGELARRDVATAAAEVKQALSGDRLPGAATVRQTPPLLEQPGRDVAARVPTGVAPEASTAAAAAGSATREPTTGERIREAATIIKEHAKVSCVTRPGG
jgi:hypothetical protein